MLAKSIKLLVNTFAVAGALALAPAYGNTYPERPIRVVVPFPAGGSTDLTARLLGERLGQALGQPIIIENRPGANGSIGADNVARANPDGYTLLFGTSGVLTINPSLYSTLRFNTLKDFAPVAVACFSRVVLVAKPSLPVKNLTELIQLAKTEPDALTFASTGTGSIAHLAGEMLNKRADIKLRHIPYKGASPAMQDLLGGRTDLMFDALVTSLPLIQAGKLKALAIPSPSRFPSLPDVPTFSEAGLPDFDVTVWNGFVAPTGTPPAIVEQLNHEINKILKNPDVQAQLLKQGLEPAPQSVAGFQSRLKNDLERWPAIVKSSGAALQ